MEMSATDGFVQPIRVETDGDQQRLCLEGVVNAALARRLKEEALVALAGTGPVTLDLARAEYLDGAALQVLLALNTELVTRGRSFKVVAMAPSVEDMLRVVGLAGALGAGQPVVVKAGRRELL
jgi:anti-anti-sigma factor